MQLYRMGDGDVIDFGNGRVEKLPAEGNVFEIQDRVFVDAVRTGDGSAIRSTYADGLASLRVGLAANESAATGKSVRV